jgi:hypothetical protein
MFAKNQNGFLRTDTILKALGEMDERPWPEWKNGQPITKHHLAKLLRPFGIRPAQHHKGGHVVRGYYWAECQEAFSRYLADEGTPPAESATSATTKGKKTKASKKKSAM